MADSARRGSEGHAAHLPGGEGGPGPQPSHQGVCRPGVPHAARVTRAAESGVPTAGAQTTLSTHTRETPNNGERARGDRGRGHRVPGPTHQRGTPAGQDRHRGALPCTLPPPGAQAAPPVTWTCLALGTWGKAKSLSLCGSPPKRISPMLGSAVRTACHTRGLQGASAWIDSLTSRRT